mmetsp:Transcript_50710/g.152730  ORF Transcript_50710/g.152730 Transcript_50710/m.152730 type:complete len:411 (-) Transcript_50710:405-1637(-)
MVKVGDFSLELVEAESKEPFREHVSPEGSYVEAEADAEYFVRLTSESSDLARVYVYVDGTDLGHGKHLRKKAALVGLWRESPETGVSEHTALRFTKSSSLSPQLSALFFPAGRDSSSSSTISSWMGTVRADFYEAINAGWYVPAVEFASAWRPGPDAPPAHPQLGGKSIATDRGSNVTAIKHSMRRRKKRRKGKLLQSIEIRYCTATGLVRAGILAPPPACTSTPRPRSRSQSCAPMVTPERKRRRVFDGRGRDAVYEEYDHFDLTHLPDDQDDDSTKIFENPAARCGEPAGISSYLPITRDSAVLERVPVQDRTNAPAGSFPMPDEAVSTNEPNISRSGPSAEMDPLSGQNASVDARPVPNGVVYTASQFAEEETASTDATSIPDKVSSADDIVRDAAISAGGEPALLV